MDERQIFITVNNIKNTQDGVDFLKFLEDLSKRNYEEFKKADTDMNNICKGKALALDSLINLFNTCSSKLNSSDTPDTPTWGA